MNSIEQEFLDFLLREYGPKSSYFTFFLRGGSFYLLREEGMTYAEIARRYDRSVKSLYGPVAAVKNALTFSARAFGKPIDAASQNAALRAFIDHHAGQRHIIRAKLNF